MDVVNSSKKCLKLVEHCSELDVELAAEEARWDRAMALRMRMPKSLSRIIQLRSEIGLVRRFALQARAQAEAREGVLCPVCAQKDGGKDAMLQTCLRAALVRFVFPNLVAEPLGDRVTACYFRPDASSLASKGRALEAAGRIASAATAAMAAIPLGSSPLTMPAAAREEIVDGIESIE